MATPDVDKMMLDMQGMRDEWNANAPPRAPTVHGDDDTSMKADALATALQARATSAQRRADVLRRYRQGDAYGTPGFGR